MEGFILAMVNMRRRPSARRNTYLSGEKSATRVLTGDEKCHQTAGPPIGRSGFSRNVSRLLLLRGSFGFDCASGAMLDSRLRILRDDHAAGAQDSDVLLCHAILR